MRCSRHKHSASSYIRCIVLKTGRNYSSLNPWTVDSRREDCLHMLWIILIEHTLCTLHGKTAQLKHILRKHRLYERNTDGIYIYIYTYTYINIHTYTHTYTHTHIHIYLYIHHYKKNRYKIPLHHIKPTDNNYLKIKRKKRTTMQEASGSYDDINGRWSIISMRLFDTVFQISL